jgi:aquaporin Z
MRAHWTEYVIEAGCLAVFMVSASAFTILLEHPISPLRAALPNPLVRRLLMGVAMGSTAAVIIYSRAGGRSGAHMNPAVTLAFARLGKIEARDAVGYVTAQFAGGLLGVAAAAALFGANLAHPAVQWVATRPGPWGIGPAFAAELLMTFVLMATVLWTSVDRRLMRRTGLAAAGLVALFITIEAPVSGMSLNPARTLGPAVLGRTFDALWIYFLAPLAGMLLAAETFRARRGLVALICAKLHHPAGVRCIFRCQFGVTNHE